MADETLLILLAALAADWKFGEPSWLWSRLPHPVVLFGRAIGWLDRSFNLESDDNGARYRKGAVGIAALIIASVLAGVLLHEAIAAGLGTSLLIAAGCLWFQGASMNLTKAL